MGVTKRYSPDQKQKHKSVTDIRDKVIAHFGFPSEKNGKEWASECAVMMVAGGQQKSQFAFRRANYLGAVITDLEELVTVAIPTAEDIVIAADQEMNGAAKPHLADQRFLKAVLSSPFHPELFLPTILRWWSPFGPAHDMKMRSCAHRKWRMRDDPVSRSLCARCRT